MEKKSGSQNESPIPPIKQGDMKNDEETFAERFRESLDKIKRSMMIFASRKK